jgi:hypothetical protein
MWKIDGGKSGSGISFANYYNWFLKIKQFPSLIQFIVWVRLIETFDLILALDMFMLKVKVAVKWKVTNMYLVLTNNRL